ncbi:MAG: hypothetical protein Q8P02_04745 [Candidatus Micrarchaeota archaeon]|nr:hypothetical protein [Candidatus Micrarchaeota archaeon]
MPALHVGTFLLTDRVHGVSTHSYAFYAGTKQQLEAMHSGTKRLVGLQKADGTVLKALKSIMPENDATAYMGEIDYLIHSKKDGKTAESWRYYPKATLEGNGKKAMKNSHPLGAVLELISLKDLQQKGVTHACTSWSPSPARRRQLVRCGIPTFFKAPIGHWILGLERDAQGKTERISFVKAILREAGVNAQYALGRVA